MKFTYLLTSAAVSAVSVVGQTACSATGAFTSYTNLVLKAFYSGNPTPVPIYVNNVLTVPHVGYDILSVSFFEILSTDRKGEIDRDLGMHEHVVLYVQAIHDPGQREAQTLGPGKHVLRDCFFARGRWGFPSVYRAVPSSSWFSFVLWCGESFYSGSLSRRMRYLTEKPI
jgi:hypothetical protein